MKDPTLRVPGYILGVFQILVAVVNFDPHSWNPILISVLLFLGGLLAMTMDMNSKLIRYARSALSYVAILLSAVLVVKLLFFD